VPIDRLPDPQSSPEASEPEAGSGVRVEKLFREYNESLVRFLNARLHSTQEAREVAQEAYIQVLGLTNRSTISFLQAYLFRTAANLATNRLKQRHRRQRIDELVFFESVNTPSPEHSFAARQDLEVISRALEGLPPKCAMAFILVKFDDMDFDQAAESMNLTPRQIRRYVARAIEHCHAALSQGPQAHTLREET
jgi:RNA polymerase sigma factor (sigma-70 family)